MKFKLPIISLSLLITVLLILYYRQNNVGIFLPNNNDSTNHSTIRFIPIGDSYTIGMGVKELDRWPNRLIRNLNNKAVDISLIVNPAVSGFTVREAIRYELPTVKLFKPDLVSVFIGANDSFMLREPSLFEKDYRDLLAKLETFMINPQNIILITLPDYTKAPGSFLYKNNFKYHDLIMSYNSIIRKISQEKKLPLVDIYPISRTMTESSDYILDGLHPSALGYQKWETVIFPVFWDVIKKME